MTTSHTQDAAARARGLAAKRGGAVKQQERAREARADRRAELVARIRQAAALVHPGEACVPAWDGAFWRVLADVTDARECDLTALGKELGLWPWSSTQITRAVGIKTGQIDGTPFERLCE